MLERHTIVSEYLLLRTPKASEATGGALGEAVAKERGNQVGLRDQVKDLVELLPTPITSDYKDGNKDVIRDGVIQTDKLARAIFSSGEITLLPTTTASDHKGANRSGSGSASANGIATTVERIVLPTPTTNGNERKGPGYSSAGILQELEIANGILPKEYANWEHAKEKVNPKIIPETKSTKTKLDNETNWGKFEPAIRQWETILGRPAPTPTKPDGQNGNHRLSSSFAEWLLGVPENWICNQGLSRTDELKMAGNGVCPQQAELALRILLDL